MLFEKGYVRLTIGRVSELGGAVISEILSGKKERSQDADLERLFAHRDRTERRTVEGLYLAAVEDRVKEMSERMRAEIAEQLRAEFQAELDTRVAAIRNQYEGLVHENGKLSAAAPELIEEIASTHAELLKTEVDLAKGLADESFPYGVLLRLRAEKMKLDSYLKGLNFRARTLHNQ